MLGEALCGLRDRVFLATKVGCLSEPGGHRSADALMRQYEESLRRLRTDWVDLIQLHEADQRKWWSDDPVPAEVAEDHCGPLIRDDEEYDFAGAPCVAFLRRAKAQGKARFVGITGKDARRLARIVRALELDGMMIAHQYNPIYRNAAHFLLPWTERKQMGISGGAMFMKGWLATPQNEWRDRPPAWMDPVLHRAYCSYLDIGRQTGMPLAELTLRWLLNEPRIHSIVLGFSWRGDIEANLAALRKGPLPPDLRRAIDAIGIVHPLVYQGRSDL
jgi:L-galactose dehydrogenase